MLEQRPQTTDAVPSPRRAPSRMRGSVDDRLLIEYARTRDPALRDRLAERWLPLARGIAVRHAGREPLDDLIQIAAVGLLKALDRYQPERGTTFSTFATPTIAGELRRHFRDRTWTVRPPRELQERALAVERASDALARRLGRAPTVDEVGAELKLDAEAVLEAREALVARHCASLSAPGPGDAELSLEERLGRYDEGLSGVERRTTLDALVAVLGPRERMILRLRFEEDLTQQEIGTLLGVSQMQVSRLLRATLETLRQAAELRGPPAAGA
jgi:RNA polymerase sigma-B factor